MNRYKKILLAGTLSVMSCSLIHAQELYKNENAPVHERVADLLSRLTVEEKISLLRATSPGIPRLGIDKYYHGNEALHGVVRPGRFTVFPQAIGLAATWNPNVVYQVGAAGGKEVKENNIAAWLTPALNIHRSPLCGRNFEYYSEDPLLAGVLAGAMVKGIQSQGVAATVKHFALNNKETDRKHSDSRVSERAAREIYLKAFEYVIKGAKPWAVMSSYNIINGCYASENKELLEDILRDEWGFDGMVTTDWWTLGEHYKEVKAGNDMKMACGDPKRLKEAMDQGLLTRQDLEHCAERVLNLILKLD